MIQLWRTMVLLSYFGLLGLLSLWIIWLAPPRTLTLALVLLVVVIGPLLVPIKGILQGRSRTHLWLSLLAILYFVIGIFNAAGALGQLWLAWIEIGLSVLLFSGSLGYARSKGPEG